MSYFPSLKDISQARLALNGMVQLTPLTVNDVLSEKFGANILLKREDLQIVRSYKIRGALNKIKSLTQEQVNKGIVCASAGNHAQGVAYTCNSLGIKGSIYMPVTTPRQKIQQVRMFGKEYVDVILIGDSFDDANKEALRYCKESEKSFIHPFDDPKIIEGQGTIGIEIMQQTQVKVDYLFVPVGGGGLAAGLGAYFKQISPETKVIGVEPSGAAGMACSIKQGKVTALDRIDTFVDGSSS